MSDKTDLDRGPYWINLTIDGRAVSVDAAMLPRTLVKERPRRDLCNEAAAVIDHLLKQNDHMARTLAECMNGPTFMGEPVMGVKA